ncbi:MAG: CocE/NonD family hydrolase [Fimbriiglobus sp.]|nr:CocE/NonD family hydrolase [Fimbriiglobus sp.]
MRWCLSFVLFAGFAFAQTRPSAPPSLSPADVEVKNLIKENYTKTEYRIPMRDGTKLFTTVYTPKDDSKTYPILLQRTPYSIGPYGVDKYPERLRPGKEFVKAGYIFAYQDVRGRWMSEGEFVNMRPHNPKKTGKEFDESSDTYDTVEWLLKNVPNHNGKVGQTGISYPGFYTVCGMINAHPAMTAVSPQAPVTDWFVGDDFHHNGCLFLPHCFNFMANFGKPRPEPIAKSPYLPFDHGTPDGYQFFLDLGAAANADKKFYKGEVAFWNEVMAHPNYDDFWKAKNIRQHIQGIRPAVMTVGGWFDAENLFGAIETFKAVERTGVPKGGNTLVMGPWDHGGWSRGPGDELGDLRFHAKTGEYFKEKVELPFFEYHLKGIGESKLPKALVFETGRNQWRKFDTWPPKGSEFVELFLAGGKLLPTLDSKATAPMEFISDPAKPVPHRNDIQISMTGDYMTTDQRHCARRPDVLVYLGEVLAEDLTVAGPIEVELHVSTTGTDADWVVKLIDVYPADFPDPDPNPKGVKMGGYQQLVRGEPFRGRYRNGFDKPEAFKPGEVAVVKFTMPDVLHTFRPGHRVMVQVQSTWFPLIDRNPQTFVPNINTAKEADYQKQTHKVHSPSKVTVRVAGR